MSAVCCKYVNLSISRRFFYLILQIRTVGEILSYQLTFQEDTSGLRGRIFGDRIHKMNVSSFITKVALFSSAGV